MLSRHRIQSRLDTDFNFSVLPPLLQFRARELAGDLPLDQIGYITQKILLVRASPLYEYIEPLSTDDQCKFFRCSRSLLYAAKNQELSPEIKLGRPTKLTNENENDLALWLEDRVSHKDYPTKREFKEKCHFFLDQQKNDQSFSRNYYDQLLKRIAPNFEVRLAQPVEFDRALLTQDSIKTYFNLIRQFDIEHISPELIINLDETGFGGSTSKRMRSVKVIVSKKHKGDLRVQDVERTSHISSLIGITAAGTMLQPCSIIARESEHPDGSKCPYFNRMKIYSTANAFITRNVFESYFKDVVFPYVSEIRSNLGLEKKTAIILYDGLKGHISKSLFSQAAELDIHIIVLPSHSSHILQPLDQGFFRSLKAIYACVPKFPNVSKISTILQKIFTAIEECDNHQLILQSWAHAGIHPIIEDGIVTHVKVDETAILNSEVITEPQMEQISERARGRRPDRGQWGLMNAEQIERVRNGQCPYCGTEMPDQEPTND